MGITLLGLLTLSLAFAPGSAAAQEPKPAFCESHTAMPLYFVAPGTASGSGSAFTIPATMPPGKYRLSQELVISWPLQRRQQRPALHAEFEVAET